MKLFTKSDLERAARLAANAALLLGGDPEAHIHAAVATVSLEAPEYYDEHRVKELLALAATRGYTEAVRALLERLDHGEARD